MGRAAGFRRWGAAAEGFSLTTGVAPAALAPAGRGGVDSNLQAAQKVPGAQSSSPHECLKISAAVLAGGGLPLQRGASMTTDKHVDPAAAVPTGDEEEDSNLQDVPEGAVRFELEPADIEEALAAPSMQVRTLCVTWRTGVRILTYLH